MGGQADLSYLPISLNMLVDEIIGHIYSAGIMGTAGYVAYLDYVNKASKAKNPLVALFALGACGVMAANLRTSKLYAAGKQNNEMILLSSLLGIFNCMHCTKSGKLMPVMGSLAFASAVVQSKFLFAPSIPDLVETE